MLDCVPLLPCSLKNLNDGRVTGRTEVSPSGKRRSPLKGFARLPALGQPLPSGSHLLTSPTWPGDISDSARPPFVPAVGPNRWLITHALSDFCKTASAGSLSTERCLVTALKRLLGRCLSRCTESITRLVIQYAPIQLG